LKCIILARSSVTANSLRIWRGLFLGRRLADENSDKQEIVFDLDEFRREGGIPAYRYLVQRIEKICELDQESSEYDSIFILVDSAQPRDLNAAINAVTWEKLVAMLILTFPEVQWIFGAFTGSSVDPGGVFPRDQSSLPSLFGAQQTPLFDATGLRDWVRRMTEESLMDKPHQKGLLLQTPHQPRRDDDPRYLPIRQRLAVSVDDESSYAYLNAYTAYRFGFRASVVHSYTLAKAALDQDAIHRANLQKDRRRFIPAILFEDLFLNFADGVRGLSQLGTSDQGPARAERWPMVEDAMVDHRIFVTSDQRLYGDRNIHSENRDYIERRSESGQNIRVILKPYAGIFQLWKRAGLDVLRPEGYNWPPHKSSYASNPHDHSSPGPLLWVAETLIHRAEEILRDGVCCAQHALRGAVLATDALELLGGRTATTSIQALRLKHTFEVLAECQFAGVEHHFEIDDRLEEIHDNAEHISRWVGRHRRTRAALNSEMQVLLELARVLHDYGHFDEEQLLANRIRTIHNGLWVRQNPWRWIFWPMLRYIDFLLDSFSRFVLSLMIWVALTAFLGWAVDHDLSKPITPEGVRGAIQFSLDAFVGKVLPPNQNVARDFLYVIAGIAGLLHIGALVSLIYSKITRK
jgi:hypothetical protein